MRVGPLFNCVKQSPPRIRMKPARVANEPSVVRHLSLLFAVENAGEVIGLRESKLGVAERSHGSKSRTLRSR